MSPETKAIVDQMDAVIKEFNNLEGNFQHAGSDSFSSWNFLEPPLVESAAVIGQLRSILTRFSPDGDRAAVNALEGMSALGGSDQYERRDFGTRARLLAGAVKGLRADYVAGRLKTLAELVHADVFSDFLEMAEYLLSEGYKDPAAVIAGSVLEEHVRKLCDKNGVLTTFVDSGGRARPKKLDTMNADLAKANVYGTAEQKQIVAWADIRNDAAHGHYTKVVKESIALMAQGIRLFVTRYPA